LRPAPAVWQGSSSCHVRNGTAHITHVGMIGPRPGLPGGRAYLVYIGGGIIGVGLLLIAIAAVMALETRLFLWRSEVTEARAIPGGRSRHIQVFVTLPDGTEARRMRKLHFEFSPDQRVRIHHHPTDPGRLAMRLDDPRDLWGEAWGHAALGLLLAAVGSVPLRIGRRYVQGDKEGRKL
jgi:hypothetical protein